MENVVMENGGLTLEYVVSITMMQRNKIADFMTLNSPLNFKENAGRKRGI